MLLFYLKSFGAKEQFCGPSCLKCAVWLWKDVQKAERSLQVQSLRGKYENPYSKKFQFEYTEKTEDGEKKCITLSQTLTSVCGCMDCELQ